VAEQPVLDLVPPQASDKLIIRDPTRLQHTAPRHHDGMAWREKLRRLDERVVPRPLNSPAARRGRSRVLLAPCVLLTVLALPFAIIRDDWNMLAVPLGVLTGALLTVALSARDRR
jgi:hypothetical protein